MSDLESPVPELRIQAPSDAPVRDDGDYVLYWMIAARRTRWNFALDHALARARALGKPLLVLEALRTGYRWASDRLHRFVIEGMADNARRLAGAGIAHHAYLEDEDDAGSGLLEALGSRAAVVVTDEFPGFFLPRMVERAAEILGDAGVRLETVDGNGLVPLRAPETTRHRAVDFRRDLQKILGEHVASMPAPDPLADPDLPAASLESLVDDDVLQRWPDRSAELAGASQGDGDLPDLSRFPIDHDVPPVEGVRGGSRAGAEVLERFLEDRLGRYQDDRRDLDDRACSGLSPYLHFGHVGAHQVFAAVAERHEWDPGRLAGPSNGARHGWWGMPEVAEAFLDELVTWRELGYVFCFRRDDYDRYESLPEWARETLEDHLGDPREHVYDLETFDRAETHDEVWNAAQRELLADGRIHNYLRMLWGKKIFEWSETPRDALEVMIELNNKYGLDGRDPNSYSGIFWCLGRFDRAWGPEREIYGKVRYMSSEQAKKKLDMKAYLERYSVSKTTRLSRRE